jgi:hypothetical protein
MTATLSVLFIATRSIMPQAAPSGSANTACSSTTLSGTSSRFVKGSRNNSACEPSLPRIPSTVLPGQCRESPPLHRSQAPQPALISPTTRRPTSDLSGASSTRPTNSWPIVPLKPAYPRAISRSVLHMPESSTRTSASPPGSGWATSRTSIFFLST